MTPYFSGGSTLNGTPGRDRWARVLCAQIGLLSESPHLVADCSESLPASGRVLLVHEYENANSWRDHKNPDPPKAYHGTHISPATATTSRRRANCHVIIILYDIGGRVPLARYETRGSGRCVSSPIAMPESGSPPSPSPLTGARTHAVSGDRDPQW